MRWILLLSLTLGACTTTAPPIPRPTPPVDVAPPEGETAEASPSPLEKESTALAGDFSETTPRGIAVKTTQDTFAAPNSSLLADVLSYAAQGDHAAVANMVAVPFPKAYAFPAESRLVFEGCDWPTDTCPFVKAREPGNDRKLTFRAEDLAIDGR